MERKVALSTHKTSTLELFSIGPPFGKKAKTVLYFFVSGKDSLTLNPIAKPALLLAEKGYRVISATLPGHADSIRPEYIRSLWGQNPNLLEEFFFNVETSLLEISDDIDGPISALGLSRGAFIATHLAARIDEINKVVGFAPLTFLESAPHLDLIHLAPKLKHKEIRYSIGHNDTLVDTTRVISTVSSFMKVLSAKQLQNSAIELTITPSIGRDGHGTSSQSFENGVKWLLEGAPKNEA